MGARVSFSLLPGTFAICRLPAKAPVPAWATASFVSVTRTADELSVVVTERRLPAGRRGAAFQAERGWALLKLHGPFPLDTIGVLASVTAPLADASISVFAISTFDTDYLLVKKAQAKEAVAALQLSGHRFVERRKAGATR